MDHVVHINNGSTEAGAIVLRLLPGEETIFNLKIVNHGEPSNVSLKTSDPAFKAVLMKKPDRYVILEETIPIMVRMPDDRRRLDGKILLSSNAGTRSVPISLLREAEDPGDDLADPGVTGDEDLLDEDDLMRRNIAADSDDEEYDDHDSDRDHEEDAEGELERVGREAEEDGEDDDESADFEEISKIQLHDGDEEERDARPIRFTRQRDLEKYRSYRSTRSVSSRTGSAGEGRDELIEPNELMEGSGQDQRNEGFEEVADDRTEHQGLDRQKDRSSSGYRTDRQSFMPDAGLGGGGSSGVGGRSSSDRGYLFQGETGQELGAEAGDVEEDYPDSQEGILAAFSAGNALRIIPAVILLALIVALVLTFVTESIPEFPGALASSILIVTLIIYGAATLLKA